MNEKGNGVQRNIEEAIRYYEIGANRGHKKCIDSHYWLTHSGFQYVMWKLFS